MKVRGAEPNDCASLAALEAERPTAAGWGVKGFVSELRQPGVLMLVAEEDGGLKGFVCARVLAPELQILNMACAVGCERKGVGSLLLRELFDRAIGRGCDTATLEVRAANAPAIACYRKAGFQIVGRRAKFYNGAEDALLMDSRLEKT